MQHPEGLGFRDTLPDGYELDQLGQIRHRATRELVCAFSGRGHTVYLLPWYQLDRDGTVRRYMIDEESIRAFRDAAKRDASAIGRKRGQLLGDLLRGVLRRLLAKL